jgi:hypothetical protein
MRFFSAEPRVILIAKAITPSPRLGASRGNPLKPKEKAPFKRGFFLGY